MGEKKQTKKKQPSQPRRRCKYFICMYAEERKEEGEKTAKGKEARGTESEYLKPSGTSRLNRITW